jgi:hypothetical protein
MKAAEKTKVIIGAVTEYHRASTANFPFKPMTDVEARTYRNAASSLSRELRSVIVSINRY